ncbi:MAG: hypothetical protein IJE52_05210 [Bacteroidales bacterium]|nr:hypothetical protein [Bacteroidales bacterium]
MKRFLIIILAMATLVAAPEQVQAQGFLKKLKEKASNAVSNTVGKVTGIDMGQQDEQQQIDGQENQITTTASATDKIPKLRQTSFVWDAEVQPSTASTVNALMQELPALPSVEEIVNPNQHSREIYYNQIVAVNLRIDELDAQWACSDAEMVAEREKLYAELQDILGLTVEEQKRLDDPAVSEAEKAALEEKIKKHIIGDFDQEKVTNTIESKRERVNQLSAESKELEKKAEKGTLTPEETNRMMEISNEIMQIQGELMQSLNMGNVMETTQKMTAFANKYSMQQQQLMQKVKKYQDKAAALAGNDEGLIMSCEEIADEYEAQLQGIYNQIYQTDDVNKIHQLYDEAEKIVKNYREKAAKKYLAGLKVRLETAKKLYPEAEQLYSEMALAGLTPACATRRAPLNLVRNCVDILNDAYEDFPQPDVMPFKIEPINIACLKPGDGLRYAESGFRSAFSYGSGASVEEVFFKETELSVYNEQDKQYYKIVNGQRVADDPQKPQDFNKRKAGKADATQESFYGDIPLRQGGRTAVYDKGGCLILHDGTMVYPLAAVRFPDRIEFITRNVYSETENSEAMFVKCTYKL